METTAATHSVDRLAKSWRTRSLLANPEYQRGAQWTLSQKQSLIDSIFRGYPVPPLFIHKRASEGLDGTVHRYEVVDGQQRLIAVADYLDDKFELLLPSDKKLRLPADLRAKPAPWGGKLFSFLPDALQKSLKEHLLPVIEITNADENEIRDLFIRLQAGTPLTKQEVRDAWPGPIPLFVQALAGRKDRKPQLPVFARADRRGDKIDDDRDPYVPHRQICAQLLRIFLEREADRFAKPSALPSDVDALYHETQVFSSSETQATRFIECLKHTEAVLAKASTLHTSSGQRRAVFKRGHIAALMLFFQDVTRAGDVALARDVYTQLAEYVVPPEEWGLPSAIRLDSGENMFGYYEQWREKLPSASIVRLDPLRDFTFEMRQEISARQHGLCAVCNTTVPTAEAEYDHYPVAHRDGGRTLSSNGRLVHAGCHPRPGAPRLR